MKVSYYPGCSLHGMAVEYDESIRSVCNAIDVDLVELADWNCCGASSAHFIDDELAVRLPARNMLIAEREGRELLVPCPGCFKGLKHADKELKKAPSRWTDESYEGRAPVSHVSEFFHRRELLEKIIQEVTKPLTGVAAVAYHGCASQRPPKLTDAESPENPITMEELLRAIGIEVRPWSYKTDCCGASLTLTRLDIIHKLSGDLFDAAVEAGAECMVTDCPMCQSNLDTRQTEIEALRGTPYGLPVFYITELLAMALGEEKPDRWWKKHFVDPVPLFRNKDLM